MSRLGQHWLPLVTISVAVVCPTACKRVGDERPAESVCASAPKKAQRGRNVSAETSAESLPESRAQLWRAAAGGDPMDLQRLANREGTDGLLDVAVRGGERARVSLAALPFAEGRGLVIGRLCRWLERAEQRERRQLLRALHRILTAPDPASEVLEREGIDECRRVLPLVLKQPLTPSEVDWASGVSERIGR